MERRHVLGLAAGSAALVGADICTAAAPDGGIVLAQAKPAKPAAPAHEHDHGAASAKPAAAAKEKPRYDALLKTHQECVRTAQACIVHCQELLAQGDKSLAECLRTALDTEAVCATVLKLGGLRSGFTPAMAKSSVPVMQACVQACKEHVKHHVQCKECHDACLKAIDASKTV